MPAKKPEIKDKIIFKEDIVFAGNDAEKPFENALQKVEQGGVYVWTFAGLVINLLPFFFTFHVFGAGSLFK